MKMKLQIRHLEQGQVIPILVIGILVTVMMAALLIDGGMVLSHRRTAQAAADAGALAAAKSLCPGSGGTYAEARAVATAFVEDNDAEFILLPDAEQFPDDHTIRVEARAASQAFFAGIFNQLGLTANAAAEAKCTITAQGAAIQLPIAVPCLDKVVDENGEIVGCGNVTPGEMGIIMNSNATTEYCFHPENNPEGVVCHNPTSSSSRGWITLDGNNNLQECWLAGNCQTPPPIIYPGTWLSNVPGNTTSFYSTLRKYLNVPLVIGIYDQESEKEPDPCPVGDNCDHLLQGGGQNAYRFVGFAELTMTCIHSRPQDRQGAGSVCEFRDYLCKNHGVTNQHNLRSVEGIFSEGSITFGPGGGQGSGQYIVQLTQ